MSVRGDLGSDICRQATSPWYRDGLRFECQQCGNCCGGPPGYVWVSREEALRIGRLLGLRPERMMGTYLRRVGGRLSLVERSNGDCVFLQRNGKTASCRIYEYRPLQCRTWPFWPVNLRSRKTWDAVARNTPCPGMNRGRVYDCRQIQQICRVHRNGA